MSHPKEWYTKRVARPNLDTVNTGMNSCPTGMLVSKFGAPRLHLTDNCQPVTSSFWKSYIVTESVGPFRATGNKLFLRALRAGFTALKESDPVLYGLLGSDGCLCCRRVRNSKNTLSNHGLGLAIDITLGGVSDEQGDNMTLQGLFGVYSVLKVQKIWWGVEFPTEDSMHFEASAQLVQHWIANGDLK